MRTKKLNKSSYVYHIGKKGYKEIKTGGMIRSQKEKDDFQKKYKLTDEKMAIYNNEVNAFLAPVTKGMVELLRSKGFNAWKGSELYLYKININDPKNRHIKYFNITSTPEQGKYDDSNWSKFYNKYKNLSDKEFQKVKVEFIEGKKKYVDKRDNYLKNMDASTNLTLRQYLNINPERFKNWSNNEKYFKINSQKGNKEQYASKIPHVQMYTEKPLVFESVQKLI